MDGFGKQPSGVLTQVGPQKMLDAHAFMERATSTCAGAALWTIEVLVNDADNQPRSKLLPRGPYPSFRQSTRVQACFPKRVEGVSGGRGHVRARVPWFKRARTSTTRGEANGLGPPNQGQKILCFEVETVDANRGKRYEDGVFQIILTLGRLSAP